MSEALRSPGVLSAWTETWYGQLGSANRLGAEGLCGTDRASAPRSGEQRGRVEKLPACPMTSLRMGSFVDFDRLTLSMFQLKGSAPRSPGVRFDPTTIHRPSVHRLRLIVPGNTTKIRMICYHLRALPR